MSEENEKKYTAQEIIDFLKKDMEQDVSMAEGNENDLQSVKFINKFIEGFADIIGNNPEMEPGLLCALILNIMNVLSKRYYLNPDIVGRKTKMSEISGHLNNNFKLAHELSESLKQEYMESDGTLFIQDMNKETEEEKSDENKIQYGANLIEKGKFPSSDKEDDDDEDNDEWRSSVFSKRPPTVH